MNQLKLRRNNKVWWERCTIAEGRCLIRFDSRWNCARVHSTLAILRSTSSAVWMNEFNFSPEIHLSTLYFMSHNWKQIAPPVFPELSPAINPLGFSQTGGFNTNGLEMKELWRLQGGGKVLNWKIEWKLYKEILLRKECVQWAFPDLFFLYCILLGNCQKKRLNWRGWDSNRKSLV